MKISLDVSNDFRKTFVEFSEMKKLKCEIWDNKFIHYELRFNLYTHNTSYQKLKKNLKIQKKKSTSIHPKTFLYKA